MSPASPPPPAHTSSGSCATGVSRLAGASRKTSPRGAANACQKWSATTPGRSGPAASTLPSRTTVRSRTPRAASIGRTASARAARPALPIASANRPATGSVRDPAVVNRYGRGRPVHEEVCRHLHRGERARDVHRKSLVHRLGLHREGAAADAELGVVDKHRQPPDVGRHPLDGRGEGRLVGDVGDGAVHRQAVLGELVPHPGQRVGGPGDDSQGEPLPAKPAQQVGTEARPRSHDDEAAGRRGELRVPGTVPGMVTITVDATARPAGVTRSRLARSGAHGLILTETLSGHPGDRRNARPGLQGWARCSRAASTAARARSGAQRW